MIQDFPDCHREVSNLLGSKSDSGRGRGKGEFTGGSEESVDRVNFRLLASETDVSHTSVVTTVI